MEGMDGSNIAIRTPACRPAGRTAVWAKTLALAGLIFLGAWASRPAWAQSASREVIGEVAVEGNRRIATQRILRHVASQPGKDFSRAQLLEDVAALGATRLFKNVGVRDEPLADGRMRVVFTVSEYPNLVKEIVYRHAKHISEKDLESMTGLRKGVPLDPVSSKSACFKIQDYLKEKGYYFANVVLEEGDKAGDERIVFNITEGPIVRVRSTNFMGQEDLATAARLRTQIDTNRSLFGLLGGVFQPRQIDADVVKLEDYYKANGYLNVRVARELKFSDDFRDVHITFHIQEGIRYKVDGVSVNGNKTFASADLKGVTRLKPGDYYNEGVVAADMRNISDYVGWRGHQALVEKKWYPVPDQQGLVRVQYEVMEKPPAKVGQIFIVGNDVTQDRVIRRVLGLYPGQTLRYPELRIAERDLARLNIFDMNPELGIRPTITVLEDTDSEFKDLLVTVKETHTGSLLFGAGVNSDAGLVGSVVLHERNFDIFRFPTSWADITEGRAFRGAGQEFRIEAAPGTELQRYTVSFREPFLFDRPYSLSLSAYYYDRYFEEYVEGRLGFRATVGHQFTKEWGANVGMRLENVHVGRISFGAPADFTSVRGDNLIVAPRVGVTYDTRDSYLRPTEGGIFEVSYEQVMGDFNFPIFNIEGSRYFTTFQRNDGSGKHVLALRTQASWAGDDAPVFERFYAGGYRSLRGFEYRGVGPNDKGFMVGGDFMLLGSLEYQVPIRANDNLYLVGFLDTGTVERDFEINDYRVTAGVGLRIIVPMMGPVPIALDFGFPIVQGPGDREQIFSFWVGLFR
jgi:outer membrane protein assembly complex protein YaeT